MTEPITESGMDFVADNCFHIEKSQLYTKKFLNSGIKSVEFIRNKGNKLVLVEAKTTFPNPENPNRFQLEAETICDKFVNSFNLFLFMKLGAGENIFPSAFTLPNENYPKFLLVIRDHEKEWCRIVEVKLQEILPRYIKKIWKAQVTVVNRKDAIKYGFVKESTLK